MTVGPGGMVGATVVVGTVVVGRGFVVVTPGKVVVLEVVVV